MLPSGQSGESRCGIHQRATAADTLVWGIAYGALFWFVGPLTLRPLILGDPVLWDMATASAFFGSLVGHVVWGAVTGLSFAVVRPLVGSSPREQNADASAPSSGRRALVRTVMLGGFAGAAAATILTALLPTENELTAPVGRGSSTNWLATLAVGTVTGSLYGALVPSSTSPTSPRLGPRLVQGIALGYIAWIVVALTIVPLQQVDALAWTAPQARDRFELFPGYVLFGALAALLFALIAGSARFLFSDALRQYDRLTAGPQRLRAIMRGVVACVVGGLLFTIVMVQVGALGSVAGLVGADAPVVGLFVHVVVGVLIGVSYGLLFRRESFDVRAGAGCGPGLRPAVVGARWPDAVARAPRRRPAVESRRGRRCDPVARRAPRLRDRVGGGVLPARSPIQPVVDHAQRGRGRDDTGTPCSAAHVGAGTVGLRRVPAGLRRHRLVARIGLTWSGAAMGGTSSRQDDSSWTVTVGPP